MKYRLKLYLAFVAIAFVSTFIALGIVYGITKDRLFNQARIKVASIAATAAELVDGALLGQVHTAQDLSSAAYSKVQDQLRKVAGVNQREDIYIKYVYTLSPNPSNPKELLFGVDSSEFPETPGEIYNYSDDPEILKNLDTPYGDKHFSKDPWGIWLSGFAPVYDGQGNYIATLGLDADVQTVLASLHHLIWYGAISLLLSLLLALVIAYLLSKIAASSLASLNATVKEIGDGNLKSESHLHSRDEFEELGDTINEMAKGLQERERLKMNFARYVSQYILEKILHSENPTKLEGENKKITVLISDIRQFTLIAEKLPPEQVVSLLNRYFEKMLDVIFRNLGTLDKFMGDGIMVEFGAPLEDPKQEQNALNCALEMQEALKILCDEWEKEDKPRLQIGIGVHTGSAIVGNIGSEKRMEYTAIGNTVIIAYRLEQATKTYKRAILVSGSTMEAAKDLFEFESLGEVVFPDRTDKIPLFALISKKIPAIKTEAEKGAQNR